MIHCHQAVFFFFLLDLRFAIGGKIES